LILLGLTVQSDSLLAQTSSAESSPAATSDATARKAKFEQAADYSAKFSGRAVLVMRKGEVLYERYDDWSATRPHMLASGTKSFTGVVAMFAAQEGLLSLDEKACDTITEWKADEKKREITIRHLLTLSSGLDPADSAFPTRGEGLRRMGGVAQDRAERIKRQDEKTGLSKLATGNWFKDSLRVPMKHNAGEMFEYGPSHFYAFGELLNRKLGQHDEIREKTFEAYARSRIFDPLDIRIGWWGKDEAGNVNIPGGLFLTAREWAKFGQFVEQRGAWKPADGSMKQLLRSELLGQCFHPSATNKSYGLTWWLGGAAGEADAGRIEETAQGQTVRQRLRQRLQEKAADADITIGGKAVRIQMAAGLGKQRLFVIPDHGLVVVRFAEPTREGQGFRDPEFLKPIFEALSSR
jgi:CubicO group peptidase (beta-lactamase class C family)